MKFMTVTKNKVAGWAILVGCASALQLLVILMKTAGEDDRDFTAAFVISNVLCWIAAFSIAAAERRISVRRLSFTGNPSQYLHRQNCEDLEEFYRKFDSAHRALTGCVVSEIRTLSSSEDELMVCRILCGEREFSFETDLDSGLAFTVGDGYSFRSMCVEHSVLKQFNGMTIAGSRSVGEYYNGFGVEIGFEGHPTQTLIITSGEACETTSGHDAIRVGIVSYWIDAEIMHALPDTKFIADHREDGKSCATPTTT